MIISASRRTDIPAFYSDWLVNRIREGYVLVRNPMNSHQISKVSLSPSVVDCIVFWTKNPQPIIDKLPLFSKYNTYFQFTLTPYDRRLECNIPSKEEVVSVFKTLSNHLGKKRVIWRYDPIILSETISIDDHVRWFESLAGQLSGYTNRCVISFLDLYRKMRKNLSDLTGVHFTSEEMREVSRRFAKIAEQHEIELASCSEKIDLSDLGVSHSRCIDGQRISEITGLTVNGKKDKSQREACGCLASVDIGAYNTCPHGCLYCYANHDLESVKYNYAKHDPASALLTGEIGATDRITERKAVSCINNRDNRVQA